MSVSDELTLQAAAITIVFVRGSIFKRIRESGPTIWRDLAGCSLCSGVWIGAAWRALHRVSMDYRSEALDCLAVGALTGVFALLIMLVLDALEQYSLP